MLYSFIVRFIFISCMSLTLPTAFGQNEAEMDALLKEIYPDKNSGASALVMKKGKVVYRKAFGMANIEVGVEMTPEHIFRIGSITKQFTAVAILQLMEAGKLSLQDDITKFLPDYPTHGHTITVEHLLTHTSGIKSYTAMDSWDGEERKKAFTPEQMIDYFKNEPMDFAPGEKWMYNNSAYFLLGYIIEKVSGMSYEEYVEEKLFKALKMESSYYGNPMQLISNRASGYQVGKNGFQNAEYLSMTQPYAAGALLSTVDDLYKWYNAVASYKVVKKESIDKAWTSYTLNDGSKTQYGYGWAIGNIQGSRMIEHGGGINGFVTASLYLPEDEIFVAVFSNCNCRFPGDVSKRLAAISLGKPFPTKPISMKKR